MSARTLRTLALAACVALTQGCAATDAEFLARPTEPIGWPSAAAPRVGVAYSVSGTRDLRPARSSMERLSNFLFGSEEFEVVAPYGLALREDEVLLVADSGQASVIWIELDSGRIRKLLGREGDPLDTPIGVAAAADGRFWVTDSVRAVVHAFDAEGRHLGSLGGPEHYGRPTGIAWDEAGRRLLVCDTTGGRLLVLAPDGTVQQTIGERGEELGQFNFPTNLCIDVDGGVWVTDTMNFRIQHLGPDLEPVAAFGLAGTGPGAFSKPKGIATDPDGHIYVVDGMFDNVQIFDTEGRLLLPFASQGTAIGQLYLPTGITIASDGRVFVSDPGNQRVQVFQYFPEP